MARAETDKQQVYTKRGGPTEKGIQNVMERWSFLTWMKRVVKEISRRKSAGRQNSSRIQSQRKNKPVPSEETMLQKSLECVRFHFSSVFVGMHTTESCSHGQTHFTTRNSICKLTDSPHLN